MISMLIVAQIPFVFFVKFVFVRLFFHCQNDVTAKLSIFTRKQHIFLSVSNVYDNCKTFNNVYYYYSLIIMIMIMIVWIINKWNMKSRQIFRFWTFSGFWLIGCWFGRQHESCVVSLTERVGDRKKFLSEWNSWSTRPRQLFRQHEHSIQNESLTLNSVRFNWIFGN